MADEASTDLVLTGQGVTPFSARGLSQTYQPIQASQNMRRTINGSLKDLSAVQFRQYQTSIQCNDQDVPALEGVWPGVEVTVDCVFEFSYKTVGGAAERPVVPGSSRTQGDYTFYRPRLTMRVTNYNVQKDEWGAAVGWSLDLEEKEPV